MRRRGRHGPAINLFSFQDIVASVIGMVFFVVLIMALDIVNAKTADGTGQSPVTAVGVEALQDTLKRLSQEVDQVQSDINQAIERLHLAGGDERQALDEVKKLEATLKALYARVRQRQEDTSKTETDRRRVAEQYQRTLQDIDHLNRQIAELKARVQYVRSAPRLAFIIDPHPGNLTPWLLEITDSRLRVASRDGLSAMLEFGGGTSADRLSRFFAWVDSQRPETHYFVLLVKPSGVDLAENMAQILKQRKFDIGMDLLPEDWEPF